MSAQIIDGKAVGAKLREAIKAEAAQLTAAGTTPGLAVILVGDDPASHVYVNNKKKGCTVNDGCSPSVWIVGGE